MARTHRTRMANPDPENHLPRGQGRPHGPDHGDRALGLPNQVNNCLGFPFIFRGALDVRAKAINVEMKARRRPRPRRPRQASVPRAWPAAYGGQHFHFGPDYIIRSPSTSASCCGKRRRSRRGHGYGRRPGAREHRRLPRVLCRTARPGPRGMRSIIHVARENPGTIVFPEGTHRRSCRPLRKCVEEGLAKPLLLGSKTAVQAAAKANDVSLERVEVVDPASTRAPIATPMSCTACASARGCARLCTPSHHQPAGVRRHDGPASAMRTAWSRA